MNFIDKFMETEVAKEHTSGYEHDYKGYKEYMNQFTEEFVNTFNSSVNPAGAPAAKPAPHNIVIPEDAPAAKSKPAMGLSGVKPS